MEVAGPLGTPPGLAQRKRASPRGEAGTSGFLCVSDSASADGHLGCFLVLAIINSAAMNIGVLVSLSLLVFSGGLRPLVELCVEPAGLCGRCTAISYKKKDDRSLECYDMLKKWETV